MRPSAAQLEEEADHSYELQILSSSRSLSAEAFNKVFSEIHARCFALVNSSDLQDKLAGVTAIGELERTVHALEGELTL